MKIQYIGFIPIIILVSWLIGYCSNELERFFDYDPYPSFSSKFFRGFGILILSGIVIGGIFWALKA